MKNIRSPDGIYKYYTAMLINRIIRMFEWKGIPESIDIDYLDFTLICNGNICFTKFGETLYACYGNVGGEPNEYYFPKLFIIANPRLGSKSVQIDIDGVVMYNTTIDRFVYENGFGYNSPLNSLICITAQQLTEVTVSALTAVKNIRAAIFVSAKDDMTRQAAERALSMIYEGNPAVIFRDNIMESLNITPNPAIGECARAIAELREEFQFHLAHFYNAIGINANYNLKRERLNTAEVNSNTDSLLINIADMLKQRQTACDKINTMFGTNITVDFSQEWKNTEAFADSFDVETEDEPTEDEGVTTDESTDS